jgi:hypothetical protein
MNSLRDISIVNMNLIPALVFIGMSDMLRALLAFELEERLGRKPTDWEWQYYLQESNRKSEADSRQQIIRQWRQQLVGMKIIHDFVWEDNSRIH